MGEDIRDKIVFEYERFYMECMSQSKTWIFTKSGEIELKKRIMKLLKNTVQTDKELEKKLLALDNVLDEVYRYVIDNRSRNDEVKNLMLKWLASL